MKNIVILGGSYAGISTAHRLLKQATKTGPFKITLVSPNSHFYWNIASPRGIIPGQITDDKLFQPIAAGFKQYPTSQFEFIVASAESVDVKAKKVEISGPAGNATLDYNFLVLATGTSSVGDTPFKGLGSTEATKDALHDFQARVEKAKTIVIAGAGATGVEVAGELGFEYGRDKEIILISSDPTVLSGRPANVSKTAIKHLQNVKVDLKLQTKVISSTPLLPDDQDKQPKQQQQQQREELTLSTGEKLITDMYIPTFGVLPNSSYLPPKFLDAQGFIAVDEFLKVKGADGGVWAIGDVSDVEPPQFFYLDKQSIYVAKTIVSLLNGKATLPYKPATSSMIGVQIGKKAGTGHFGSVTLPGFLTVYLRKTLFVERLGPMVNGSAF